MKAATVPTPAHSTMTSNVTGMNAGQEFHGLPPTLIGQLTAVAQYWKTSIVTAPEQAKQEAHPRQAGRTKAHGPIQTVDGVRREHVDDLSPCFRAAAGRLQNIVFALEDADESRRSSAGAYSLRWRCRLRS